MREVVIVEAVRTPIGKLGGTLAGVRPDDLLAKTLRGVVERSGIDVTHIDEVIAGCANQAGEDNRNVARMACLIAGFPYEVPALTVNRLCASGLEAVIQAARGIQCGDYEVAIACGVESMSRAPWVMGKPEKAYEGGNRTVFDSSLGWRFPNRALEKRFPLESMGETAENIADQTKISRAEQDHFALRSHQRACAAIENGSFSNELLSLEVGQSKNAQHLQRDEGPRYDTSLEKLASLKPVFRTGGSVTAGNSSSLNDGAAALLLTSHDYAKRAGLKVLASMVGCASAGTDPRLMGLGPIPATQKLLKKTGVQLQDIDRFEINEAFAVQTLAVARALAIDMDKVNVNGGAIALGHPLGCSGARLVTTLVYELRRSKKSLGLATLCVGVGQGVSVLLRCAA